MLNAVKIKENMAKSKYIQNSLGEYGVWSWEAFGYAMAVIFGGLTLIIIVCGCRNWRLNCLGNKSVWNYFLTKLRSVWTYINGVCKTVRPGSPAS